MNEIKVYAARAFTSRFMPFLELNALRKGDLTRFLAWGPEDMYRYVEHAVLPSWSHMHAYLRLTGGGLPLKQAAKYTASGR